MRTVVIFAAPRSGTSWLGQLFNSSPAVAYRFQPLFSFAYKGRIGPDATREDIDAFHDELLQTNDEFVLQRRNISGAAGPAFRKGTTTHLVWKEVRYQHVIPALLRHPEVQVIGLVRHPCAVISSWLRAPREFDPAWDAREEWRLGAKKNRGRIEECFGFERWRSLTRSFLGLSKDCPDRFRLVRYEELNQDPEVVLAGLFAWCGLSVDEQTRSFIRQSRSMDDGDSYGVFRKGNDSERWRGELDAVIRQSIEREILEDPDLSELYPLMKMNREGTMT